MANRLDFFMAPEDEVAFFRMLEPWGLELRPMRFSPDAEPFPVNAQTPEGLADPSYSFVLPRGELVLHTLKRGPDSGLVEVDEVLSDVIHLERSLLDEEGVLRSGHVWVEFELVGDRMHRQTKPARLRALLEEMRAHFKKRFHKSSPQGYFVGSIAARKVGDGLELREAGRKGGPVRPYR